MGACRPLEVVKRRKKSRMRLTGIIEEARSAITSSATRYGVKAVILGNLSPIDCSGITGAKQFRKISFCRSCYVSRQKSKPTIGTANEGVNRKCLNGSKKVIGGPLH